MRDLCLCSLIAFFSDHDLSVEVLKFLVISILGSQYCFSFFCSILHPTFAMLSLPINAVPMTGGLVNSSSGVVNNFAYHVMAKLTDDSFLLWKQQIEPVLKVHHLQRFVVSPLIPPMYITQEDAERVV